MTHFNNIRSMDIMQLLSFTKVDDDQTKIPHDRMRVISHYVGNKTLKSLLE